jgi:hypothetical protein
VKTGAQGKKVDNMLTFFGNQPSLFIYVSHAISTSLRKALALFNGLFANFYMCIPFLLLSSSRTGSYFLSVKQKVSKEFKKKRCSPAFGPRAPRRFFDPPHMVSAKLYKHDFLSQLLGGLFYLFDFLYNNF